MMSVIIKKLQKGNHLCLVLRLTRFGVFASIKSIKSDTASDTSSDTSVDTSSDTNASTLIVSNPVEDTDFLVEDPEA